jgi:hypothetical protein
MILTLVKGRLGNNLFQYFLGHTIAERRFASLNLDATLDKELIRANDLALVCLPVLQGGKNDLSLRGNLTFLLTSRSKKSKILTDSL